MKISPLLLVLLAIGSLQAHAATNTLDQGWNNPPAESRIRAYWWWLNSNVTKESITHDLEEMKAKGFGGAVIFDADGSDQQGNARVPNGPAFFSPAWRDLYKHSLREASRLGLEISLNIQSGWNIGGPMVKAEDAVKKLTWSETEAETNAAGAISIKLPSPPANDGFYRDLYILAWRNAEATPPSPPDSLPNLSAKSFQKTPQVKGRNAFMALNSAPDTTPFLLDEDPNDTSGADLHKSEIIDLTKILSEDGTLNWAKAPAGRWHILRVGFTLGDKRLVSTSSEGWKGYALDVLDEGAFRRYWGAVVAPLISDAGPLAGKTLRYLHTDSWEIGVFNWTPTLREEFLARRGYDLVPWLPVFSGRIVEGRTQSNRFLRDFRRTIGDLAVAHHYQPFATLAAQHGMGIHPEAGGPHYTPIDAQQCLAATSVPMSEFWATADTHRSTDESRFFVKQPASAAHITGQRFVSAEGFTTVGPHWEERLWNNLKPSFDYACTEGLNRLVWHAFVCSPKETGIPGQQYFAGTHFNPKVTWWNQSTPFLLYLNRCQFLLQQGIPVADALYYYGDDVPNFTRLRSSDPAKLGAGYDYDVINAENLLTRISVKNGLLMLPEGVSYRVLVLPEQKAISLTVLQKVQELVAAGATIIGPRPTSATGLSGFPQADETVKKIAAGLWDQPLSSGRVITGKTTRDFLTEDGVKPDFTLTGGDKQTDVRYIHRRDGGTDIYFVASRGTRPESLRATFRVSGMLPEIWDAVTGEHRAATAYECRDGLTTVPLDLPPCGSVFVIFRNPTISASGSGKSNSPVFTPRLDLSAPWTVRFDPRWGGPVSATFTTLESWTARAEPGIKYYSGTATYQQTFKLPADLIGKNLTLDLGDVREIAEVRLNGKSLGILWAPPFRMNITTAMRPGANQLEVDVINFWPNRIIGDASLPPAERLTKTNIRKLTGKTPLMESGLLGPARLLELGTK